MWASHTHKHKKKNFFFISWRKDPENYSWFMQFRCGSPYQEVVKCEIRKRAAHCLHQTLYGKNAYLSAHQKNWDFSPISTAPSVIMKSLNKRHMYFLKNAALLFHILVPPYKPAAAGNIDFPQRRNLYMYCYRYLKKKYSIIRNSSSVYSKRLPLMWTWKQ